MKTFIFSKFYIIFKSNHTKGVIILDIGAHVEGMGGVFAGIGENILNALPGVLLAIIILLLGYLVALIVRVLVEKLLVKMKLDEKVIKKTELKKLIGDFKLAHFIALIIKWYIFILFFPLAADALGFTGTSNFLMRLSVWIPNLIAAIFVAIIGILIATYIKNKIEVMNFHNAVFVAGVSYIIVLIFTILIAFEQIGINVSLVSDSFLIILAGIMLAVGIGFGLGMKSEAERIVKSWKKKL